MRDLNIIYDGIGSFNQNNKKGNYYIVLPLENPNNDYDFVFFNFSSTSHNRVLILMKKKTSGADSDLSIRYTDKPYMPSVEIDLTSLEPNPFPSLPNQANIVTNDDVEVILYHNDTTDSIIEAYYYTDIEPIIPNKIGFGTFKKA